jgi:hypothetical protein
MTQEAHPQKYKTVGNVNHPVCKMNNAGDQAVVTESYLVSCIPPHRLILNALMQGGMKQTNAHTEKLLSTWFTKHTNAITVTAQANVTTVVNWFLFNGMDSQSD